jgi:preprotein translocase subunit SecG
LPGSLPGLGEIMLETVLLITVVVVAVALVGLILLQHGKGADAGASFGSGASQTVFGSTGAGNFLTHTSAILATLFFVTCLALAYVSRENALSNQDFTIGADEGQVMVAEPAPDQAAGDSAGVLDLPAPIGGEVDGAVEDSPFSDSDVPSASPDAMPARQE